MLPCLNKKIFGIDCMGCGLQRSVVLLAQGEFTAAFKMYPAIYTLVFFLFIVIYNVLKPFQYANKTMTVLAILNVIIIVANFIYKLLL